MTTLTSQSHPPTHEAHLRPPSSKPTTFSHLPPELLHHIVSLIYLDSIPRAVFRCLDPHGLPSAYEDGRLISRTSRQATSDLLSISRTNKALYAAARPLLFRRLQITLPFSFLLLLRTLGAAHLAEAYEEHERLRKPTTSDDSTDEGAFFTSDAASSSSDEEESSRGEEDPGIPAHRAHQTPSRSPLREQGRSSTQSPPRNRSRSHQALSDAGAGGSAGLERSDVRTGPKKQLGFSAMVAAAGFARVTGSKLVIQKDRRDRLLRSQQSGSAPSGATDTESAADERSGAEMQLVWIEQSAGLFSLSLSRAPRGANHYPRVLDFSTFTTQGMRRSLGQGETRFITPARLLALITAADALVSVGFCESMDSAIDVAVLEALLFRDGKLTPPSRIRGISMERARREGSERRRLQAMDLSGCISNAFKAGLQTFVDRHLNKSSGRSTSTLFEESETSTADDDESQVDEEEDRRGRSRSTHRTGTSEWSSARSSSARTARSSQQVQRSLSRYSRADDDEAPSTHPARATRFPSLRRLSLSYVTFPESLLQPFILSFPRLIHLDLTGTKIGPQTLFLLGAQPGLHLHSLSLAKCPHMSSESIRWLLVDSPVCHSLTELSLAGTLLQPTPIDALDMKAILTEAPCMLHGAMRYLDLASCPVAEVLGEIHVQPCLLDLGLGSLPRLSLSKISEFLIAKAPNVQVLSIPETSSALGSGALSPMDIVESLLRPCAVPPPLTLSQQLAQMGLPQLLGAQPNAAPVQRAKTNLRVVELALGPLRGFGKYHGWQAIFGAGRRGWLVDCTAGPNPDAVDEALAEPDEEGGAAAQQAQGEQETRGRPLRWKSRAKATSWEPETPPTLTRKSTLSPSPARRARRTPLVSRSGSMRRANSRGGDAQRSLTSAAVASATQASMTVAADQIDETTPSLFDQAGPAVARGVAPSDVEPEIVEPRNEVVRGLPLEHPRAKVLQQLAAANGHVPGNIGWHSLKCEILLGYGFLGREQGRYAYIAYQV
ncbi:F-BOX/LEUCINE RICH REPEAT PROTEIN [Ceraceosorus bombacis]|uniref:F-BOX/LEUCINE RICH REPEAT PROTEIN n=1 Tax=Ceraceosorus bombacis TaxID=401625 RepID=A0A0P1BJ32_9BASI|nr:F-BOX/LEUCINE RICH REPEAT PROTEIN [Ceraceosorus bombacis]